MKAKILNRKLHRWAAIVTALPVVIVIISGIILQVKKEFDWIQPPTQRGAASVPALGFDQILGAVRNVPDAGLTRWEDIDRLDVRPGKGVIKVRGNNDWEIQLDAATGEVLQVAVRRSDLIESIHDGSFFHERFKLWVFLPSAVILAAMWGTGIYLFLLPYMLRKHRRRKTWNRKARVDAQRQTVSG
jgi:uncharacterized iron-regulated membrane protein